MDSTGSGRGEGPPTEAVDREARPGAVEGVVRVLESFHERYMADRAAGRIRPVQEYASLFPGFEDVVRERYRRLREEDPPVHVPTSPGPTLAHLVGMGLRNPPAGEEIARGGMGAVYRTRDDILHRDLAMKVILDEKARLHVGGEAGGVPTVNASTSLRRMMLEAQITAQLSHPGIVPVHEMGIDREGRLFFTMKLVRGRTLDDIFRLQREKREGWTLTRALQVFIRICETLAFAHHKGVIHRDLKPPNIMVGTYGEVYVMDWGIAKVLHPDPGAEPLTVASTLAELDADVPEPDPLTRMGDIVGTPEYMPPEQALGRLDELDRRTDVYAVGAMLYEMLTDRAPYSDPDTPRTPVRILQNVMRGPPEPAERYAPDAPAELLAVCRKAMARERRDRYQTAEELANDLHRFLEGRVVLAHASGPLVEMRSWIRRNTAVAWTAAISFALLVAGAIGFGVEQRRAAERIGAERDAARDAEAREREARERTVGLLLASRAAALADEKPADALQIAVEAAVRAPGAESRGALYAALVRHHERRRLIGHDGYVVEGHFSPEGNRVLTREADSCAILWDAASGKVLRRIFEPGVALRRSIFSPDGSRIALATGDGRVLLADGATGAPLRAAGGHEGPVEALAFSPDGRTLASGGEDGRVVLRSAGTGEPIRTLEAGAAAVLDLDFSPAGDRLSSLAGDGTWALWDPSTGARLAQGEPTAEDGEDRAVTADRHTVRFLEGGRLLAVWRDPELRVLRVEGDRPEPVLERAAVRAFAVSGDGRRFAAVEDSASEGRFLERWDAGEPGTSRVVPGADLEWLALDRSGGRASGGSGYDGQVWDLDEGRRIAVLRGHHYGAIRSEWDPGGDRLLTVSSDMTARIWAVEPVDALRLPAGAPRERWSPDGLRHLETTGPEDAESVPVVLLGAGAGQEAVEIPGPIRSLRWLPDGIHFYGLSDRELVFVRASDGAIRGRVPVPTTDRMERHTRVVASDDLTRTAMRIEDGVVGVAEIATGTWLPHRFPNRADFVLSPDGRRLLTHGGADPTATIWDVDGGVPLHVLAGHTGWVLAGAWSPDGARVSTSAVEGRIRVWDASRGTLVTTAGPLPMGRADPDFAVGRDWVLTCRGGEVIVFHRETGDRLFSLRETGEFGVIREARFLPGGEALATDTGDGGIVRRWPLDPLPVARERFPIDLDPAAVREYDLLPPSEAEAYADDWLLRHPTARILCRRALVLLKEGRAAEAEEWIDRCREIRPDLAYADWAAACLLSVRSRGLPSGPERAALRGRAIDALARSLEGDTHVTRALAATEDLLAPLREEPRFRSLVGE